MRAALLQALALVLAVSLFTLVLLRGDLALVL